MRLTLLPIPCTTPNAKGHLVQELTERVDYKCDPCWQKQREEEQAKKFDLQGNDQQADGDGDGDEDADARDEEEMERIRRRRGGSA
jgi:hypothetical protein